MQKLTEIRVLEQQLKGIQETAKTTESEGAEWVHVSLVICYKGDQTAEGDKRVYMVFKKNSSSDEKNTADFLYNVEITEYVRLRDGSYRTFPMLFANNYDANCKEEIKEKKAEYEERYDSKGRKHVYYFIPDWI